MTHGLSPRLSALLKLVENGMSLLVVREKMNVWESAGS